MPTRLKQINLALVSMRSLMKARSVALLPVASNQTGLIMIAWLSRHSICEGRIRTAHRELMCLPCSVQGMPDQHLRLPHTRRLSASKV